MQSVNKFEQKVIASLHKLFTQEEKELRRFRFWRFFCLFVGVSLPVLGVLLANLFPKWASHVAPLGFFGGLMVGLSLLFKISALQWPILKRFLNAQAIEDAHKQQIP